MTIRVNKSYVDDRRGRGRPCVRLLYGVKKACYVVSLELRDVKVKTTWIESRGGTL